MSISQGQKILASDMSKILTTDNFLNNIDLNALKEALGVSANTSAAKIVGGCSGLCNGSTAYDFKTTDYDYLVISVYPAYPWNQQYNAYGNTSQNIGPVETIVPKGVTSPTIIGYVGYYETSNYYMYNSSITGVTGTISGSTIKIASMAGTNYAATPAFSCVAYKNS